MWGGREAMGWPWLELAGGLWLGASVLMQCCQKNWHKAKGKDISGLTGARIRKAGVVSRRRKKVKLPKSKLVEYQTASHLQPPSSSGTGTGTVPDSALLTSTHGQASTTNDTQFECIPQTEPPYQTQQQAEKIAAIKAGLRVHRRHPDYKTLAEIMSDYDESPTVHPPRQPSPKPKPVPKQKTSEDPANAAIRAGLRVRRRDPHAATLYDVQSDWSDLRPPFQPLPQLHSLQSLPPPQSQDQRLLPCQHNAPPPFADEASQSDRVPAHT